MLQVTWLILFIVLVVALTVAVIALILEQRNSLCNEKREYLAAYDQPQYESAGFKVSAFPSTDILIPQRCWLVNERTAQLDFMVLPITPIRFRIAKSGDLRIPPDFLSETYECTASYEIQNILITEKCSPGRKAMFSWSKNGYDYVMLCRQPEMNLMGGVLDDFISQTTVETISE